MPKVCVLLEGIGNSKKSLTHDDGFLSDRQLDTCPESGMNYDISSICLGCNVIMTCVFPAYGSSRTE